MDGVGDPRQDPRRGVGSGGGGVWKLESKAGSKTGGGKFTNQIPAKSKSQKQNK